MKKNYLLKLSLQLKLNLLTKTIPMLLNREKVFFLKTRKMQIQQLTLMNL